MRNYIILCCILQVTCCFSQTIIKGIVQDSITQEAIGFANIILEDEKKTVLEFTVTAINGIFELTLNKNSLPFYLTVSYLGYRKKRIKLGKKNYYEINISSAQFQLEEIYVVAKSPPILSKSDTTEFSVSSFTDSTEQNIEDVLKKLPGFRVDKQGGITVNGKQIKKIMIEGDDLTGGNYTKITKNIRGNVLKKVQAIDNYTENPVLKEHVFSDDLVLNLTLTDETKHIFTGNTFLGVGYGDTIKYDFKANIFSISKKSKTILALNTNNTGFQSFGEIDFRYNNLGHSKELEDKKLGYKSKIYIGQNDIGLPNQYLDDGNSKLLFIGNVFTIKNTKIKTSGTFYEDTNNLRSFDNISYQDILEPFVLTSNSLSKEKKKKIEASLSTTYVRSDNDLSLKTFSKIIINENSNKELIEQFTTIDNLNTSIETNHRNTPSSFFSGIELSTKVFSKGISQTAITYSRIKDKDSYSAEFNPAFRYIGQHLLYSINQNLLVEAEKISISEAYLLNLKKGLNFQLYVDYNSINNDFGQEFMEENASNQSFNLPFSRKLNWQEYSFLSLLNKSIKNGTFSLGYKHQVYHFNKQQLAGLQNNHALKNPFLKIRITSNDGHKLTSSLFYKEQLLDPYLFYKGRIVKKINDLEFGYDRMNISSHLGIDVQLRKKNSFNGYFYNIFFNANQSVNALSTDTKIFPNYQETSYFLSAPMFTILGGGEVEKILYKAKSLISLNSTFSFSNYQYSIAKELIDVSHKNYDFEIGYSIDMATKVFISLFQEFSLNKITQQALDNSATTYISKVEIKFKPSKSLLFSIQGNYNKDINSYSRSSNLTFDSWIKIKLHIGKKQSNLSLKGVNLLNIKNYTFSSINNYSSSRNGYYLVPRHFTINWEQHF